jgi:hypothetical protein
MMDTPVPEPPLNLDDYTEKMIERMRSAFHLVRTNLDCAFSRAKKRYDERVRSVKFEIDDLVWFFCPRRKRHLGSKWQLLTTGPWKIVRKLNSVNYVIRRHARGKALVVHVDRLRRYEGAESAAPRQRRR